MLRVLVATSVVNLGEHKDSHLCLPRQIEDGGQTSNTRETGRQGQRKTEGRQGGGGGGGG